MWWAGSLGPRRQGPGPKAVTAPAPGSPMQSTAVCRGRAPSAGDLPSEDRSHGTGMRTVVRSELSAPTATQNQRDAGRGAVPSYLLT